MSGGRQFNVVSPALWRSPRFLKLSSDARVLHLFMLTSEHQNSSGSFRLPGGYACADLGWTLDQYEAARKELCESELVLFDDTTDEVYVLRWFKHARPANDKHAQGAASRIDKIESDRIHHQAEADFEEAEGERRDKASVAQNSRLTQSRYLSGGRA